MTSQHTDVTEPMHSRKQLITTIREYCSWMGGRSFLLGDFNFVVSGESLLDGDDSQSLHHHHLSEHFEAVFCDYCELRQHDFTFLLLAKDSKSASSFSRIDRICSGVHTSAFEDFRMQVSVMGGWERGKAASDHRAVILRLNRREAPGRRRLRYHAVSHKDLQAVLAEEEALTSDIKDKALRHAAIASNAFAAQRRILQPMSLCAAGQPQYVADRCFAVYRPLRQSDGRRALAIASVVEELRKSIRHGNLDLRTLGRTRSTGRSP